MQLNGGIDNCRLQIADYRLQITDYRLYVSEIG
jgi:hypothetical protein